MIPRVGGFLIQDLEGLPVELGKISFESEIEYLRSVGTITVFNEKCKTVGVSKEPALHRHFLDL